MNNNIRRKIYMIPLGESQNLLHSATMGSQQVASNAVIK
jgi:hypothetical protein